MTNYRQEFRAAYPQRDIRLPALLVDQGNGLELLIESDEIKACGNLEELMLFTRRKVEWACLGLSTNRTKPTADGAARQLERNISRTGVSHL